MGAGVPGALLCLPRQRGMEGDLVTLGIGGRGITPQRTKTEGGRQVRPALKCMLECCSGLGDNRSVHKARPAREEAGEWGLCTSYNIIFRESQLICHLLKSLVDRPF